MERRTVLIWPRPSCNYFLMYTIIWYTGYDKDWLRSQDQFRNHARQQIVDDAISCDNGRLEITNYRIFCISYNKQRAWYLLGATSAFHEKRNGTANLRNYKGLDARYGEHTNCHFGKNPRNITQGYAHQGWHRRAGCCSPFGPCRTQPRRKKKGERRLVRQNSVAAVCKQQKRSRERTKWADKRKSRPSRVLSWKQRNYTTLANEPNMPIAVKKFLTRQLSSNKYKNDFWAELKWLDTTFKWPHRSTTFQLRSLSC